MHTELAYRDDIAVGGGILYTDILYYVCMLDINNYFYFSISTLVHSPFISYPPTHPVFPYFSSI